MKSYISAMLIGALSVGASAFAQNTFPSSGDVGIGTVKPNSSFLLDTLGLVRAYSPTNNAGVYIGSVAANVGVVQGINAANNATVPLYLQSSGGNVIMPNTTTFVGIRTTTPTAPLTVNGMIASLTGGYIFPDGTVQNSAQMLSVKALFGTCAAAVGNGATDDTVAIQCHLNYMYNKYGGGIVFFPPGSYLVSGGGLIIQGGVQVVGSGQGVTAIMVTSNANVVTFDPSTCNKGGAHASLSNLAVYGYQSTSATTNAVTIGLNCAVILRDDTIWFGYSGLYNEGTDSLVENSFIYGYWAAVTSAGANWYVRDKFDTLGAGYSSSYAFYQGSYAYSSSAVVENHLVQCDFSGSYTYSIGIQDPNREAITVIDGSVFSAPVIIGGGKWTSFSNDEIGGTITSSSSNSGVVSVTGSYGFGGVSVVSAGAPVVGSGNYNISIPGQASTMSSEKSSKIASSAGFGTGLIGSGYSLAMNDSGTPLSSVLNKRNIVDLSQNSLDSLVKPGLYTKLIEDSDAIHSRLDSLTAENVKLKTEKDRDIASLKGENADLRARLDAMESKLDGKKVH